MQVKVTLLVSLLVISAMANADLRELVAEEMLLQIAEETSGEAAKRNLDTLTTHHRMRASDQFGEATQHIAKMLRHYGLDEVEILEYAGRWAKQALEPGRRPRRRECRTPRLPV